MKIFHTADWHLGKLVQGFYMTDDQRHVIGQLIAAIDEEQPDVVIIAGDLYDRALPPVEAVNLLDELLAEIVLKRKVPVLAIAGNHDSPTRVQFGSKLMKESGLHIVGELSAPLEPVVLQDEHGEVHFHLIPFAEPSLVREKYTNQVISTYDEAMQLVTEQIASTMKKDVRHVAIAHAFVTPYGESQDNTSESERPLSIGGSEYVSAKHFEPFHYTALGHLHRAHYVLHEHIRYAGSPLKFSSSEATHEKGFFIVDLAADGSVEIDKRVFKPKRDLRIVEGTLQEILRHDKSEDYVFIQLTDRTPVVGAMDQIRTVYENAMHVARKVQPVELTERAQFVKREQLDDSALFHAFYEQMTGTEATKAARAIFEDVLQEMLSEERESQGAKS